MITIILNHQPYDGTDVTWNALRLEKNLHKNESYLDDKVSSTMEVSSKWVCQSTQVLTF